MPKKIQLVASDEKQPAIQLKPGMRFEVTSISLVDAKLKATTKIGARLCGGTSTCIALVEVGPGKVEGSK